MKILVTSPVGYTRDTFFTDRSKKMLEELGEVEYNSYDRMFTPEELKDKLEGVDALITGWGTPSLTEDVLEKADQLKVVAHTGGTVASLATDTVYDRGIIVLSGNPVFAESVAESCVCYAMAALRDIPKYSNLVRAGGWRTDDFYNAGIMDRTVGIVGFGMIAKFFAKMLQPFRCEIKIYSSYLTQEEAAKYNATVVPLNEIFETCDIISVHSGSNPKTFHLVGEEQLKKIKDGALLINTARGAVIDEEAMIRELETLRFKAALDVFTKEPLDADSKLRYLPNVLAIPHMGGPTIDRREYVTLALAKDIKEFTEGKKDGFYCQISEAYAKNQTR